MFKTLGKLPSGKELERIEQSPNYQRNTFKNLSDTPVMVKEASFIRTLFKFIKKPSGATPSSPLPSVKRDLWHPLSPNPVVTWFGHSSYLIQVAGKNILVDPVFSGYASPLPAFAKSFPGSDIYRAEDMPDIDILLITHDHYDHLDYKTVLALRKKTKIICTALGVGAHLRSWGIEADKIREFDWWETKQIIDDIEIIAAPARHFSGRGLSRGKSLWSSFIIRTGEYNLYAGGDSGYDTHFNSIGRQFGPFDIAILECGQYNENWIYIHMMPEETVKAAIDLKARVLLPVHWGKFTISLHTWDEPVKRVVAEANKQNMHVTTPMIGEPVILGQSYPDSKWWELV